MNIDFQGQKQGSIEISGMESWAALCFFFSLAFWLYFPISHNDIWWHLKSGAWLLEHRSFPAKDPFSYSSADTIWLKRDWLFGLLAWPVYKAFGPGGLISAKILLAELAAALVLIRVLRQGGSLLPCLALLAAAFFDSRFYWTERPQSVSFVFWCIGFLALDLELGCWRAPIFFLFGTLWINLHDSGLLWPLMALADSLDRARHRKPWALSFGAAILACLVHPEGWGEALQALGVMHGSSRLFGLITEWRRPDSLLTLSNLLLALSLPWLAWEFFETHRIKNLALALLALGLALHSRRMIPYEGLAVAALFPPLLGRQLGKAAWLSALFGLAFLLSIRLPWREPYFGRVLALSQIPVQAADFLERKPPKGHLGNLYKDGAYLLFRLAPKTRVFIDSRQTNYPEQIFQDAVSLEMAKDWKSVAHKYGFGCILTPLKSPLQQALAKESSWRLVFFDQNYCVYASEMEYLLQRGAWPDYSGLDLAEPGFRKFRPEVAKALAARLEAQNPDALGCYLLGLAEEKLGHRAAARKAYEEGIGLDPSQPLLIRAALRLGSFLD
jgi:hypothetical protein